MSATVVARQVRSRPRLPVAIRQPSIAFIAALALFICVTVGRLHEVVPILTRIYIGKLSAFVLIIAFFSEGSRLPVARALKTRTAKCVGVITALALVSIPSSFWPGYSVNFVTQVWPFVLLLAVGILSGFSDTRTAFVCISCLLVVGTMAAAELILGGGMATATSLSASSSAGTETRAYIGGGGSTTYDANYSAAFFVMLLPYAMMLASRPGRLRVIGIGAVPVLAMAMISTGSRGGIIALAVLLVCTVIFAEKRQRKVQLLFFGLAIGAMLLAPHAELAGRLQNLVSGSDYNYDARDGRWAVWQRGIGFMLHYPLTGVGIGAFMSANGSTARSFVDAHSAYVQIAAELGVGGIVTFALLIIAAFQAVIRRRKATRSPAISAGNGRPAPPQSLEAAIATAALLSLIAELTAAAFLSMAYEAMTMFALTVPTALGLASLSAQSSGKAIERRMRVPVRGPAGRPATARTLPRRI